VKEFFKIKEHCNNPNYSITSRIPPLNVVW
jgi:hypothetical protein